MSLISREGTYRGIPIDSGVGQSSGGYPQFIVSLQATGYFDQQEKEWIDWSDQDEEIIAYLILFDGKGKPTLNAKQIQKAFGWSGQSFQELNNTDYSETQIQFRVEEHTYEEKTSMQVNWVAEYDATPGRTVTKLEGKDLKNLEAAYANSLKALGGTKVASAKPTVPTPTTPLEVPETAVTDKPIPPVPTAKEEKSEVSKVDKRTTKIKAWRYAAQLKQEVAPDLSDDELATLWTDTIKQVAPNTKKGNLTPEQWYKVQETVAVELAKF